MVPNYDGNYCIALKEFKAAKIKQLNDILDKKYWHCRNKGFS